MVLGFLRHEVLALDAAGRLGVIARMTQQPSGLGWLHRGRLLIVSILDQTILRPEPDDSLVSMPTSPASCWGRATTWWWRSAVGRTWGASTSDRRGGAPLVTSGLVLVEPDGRARPVAVPRVAGPMFVPLVRSLAERCIVVPPRSYHQESGSLGLHCAEATTARSSGGDRAGIDDSAKPSRSRVTIAVEPAARAASCRTASS